MTHHQRHHRLLLPPSPSYSAYRAKVALNKRRAYLAVAENDHLSQLVPWSKADLEILHHRPVSPQATSPQISRNKGAELGYSSVAKHSTVVRFQQRETKSKQIWLSNWLASVAKWNAILWESKHLFKTHLLVYYLRVFNMRVWVATTVGNWNLSWIFLPNKCLCSQRMTRRVVSQLQKRANYITVTARRAWLYTNSITMIEHHIWGLIRLECLSTGDYITWPTARTHRSVSL